MTALKTEIGLMVNALPDLLIYVTANRDQNQLYFDIVSILMFFVWFVWIVSTSLLQAIQSEQSIQPILTATITRLSSGTGR